MHSGLYAIAKSLIPDFLGHSGVLSSKSGKSINPELFRDLDGLVHLWVCATVSQGAQGAERSFPGVRKAFQGAELNLGFPKVRQRFQDSSRV